MMFDRTIISDDSAFFHKTSVTDIAVAADHSAFMNIRKRPNARALADLRVGMNKRFVMFKVTHTVMHAPFCSIER